MEIIIRTVFKVKGAATLNERAAHWWGKAGIAAEYALRRSGPMAMAPSQLGIFTRSDPDLATPDLEYHVQPLSLDRFGEPLATPYATLTRLFPAPAVLAQAEGEALGQLGIVKQRQAAIVGIARAVAGGQIALHGGADIPSTIAALKELPGIGDWTAQYIAMRALRWPDAFPSGDVALQSALNVRADKHPARAAEAASQAWKPWRSYAVIRAWASLTPRTSA